MLTEDEVLPATGPAVKFSHQAIQDLEGMSRSLDCDLRLLIHEVRYLVSGRNPDDSIVYRETALYDRQFIQGAGLYIWYDSIESVALVVEVSSVSEDLTPHQLKRWKALRANKERGSA